MYLAFQHVNIRSEIQDDGNLYVEIHDIYNFDSIRTPISISGAANDYRLVVQTLHIITPFQIYVRGYEWAGKPATSNNIGGDTFVTVAKQELVKGVK